MLRKMMRLLIPVGFLLAASLPVFSQNAPAGDPQLVQQLVAQLEHDGWSADRATAIGSSAAALDWGGTEGASPQVVALALEFAAARGPEATPALQAQLALQVALAAAEMHSVGVDEQSTAVAALNAVRTMLQQMEQLRSQNATGEQIALRIRESVAAAVRAQLQNQAGNALQSHGPGQNRVGGPDFGPGGFGGGAPSGGGPLGPPVSPPRGRHS